MSASRIIKQLMAETDTSVKHLADGMGCNPQSFSNRLYRGTFSYSDFAKVVSLMGCKVQVVTSSGKVFEDIYDPEDEIRGQTKKEQK